jgi:Zn-dependent protease
LRIGGLVGRIHWIVLLYLTCELVAWLPERKPGVMQAGALVGSLLVLAFARELGRGLLARRLGSTIDHVTVWPLGGLNSVVTPRTRHPIAAESGGLLIGAILLPVLALAAMAAGCSSADLLLNPYAPLAVLNNPQAPLTPLRVILWSAYFMNAVLLAANLLPMFPMDAGRILAAQFRHEDPTLTADERVARVSFFMSVALFVFAAALSQPRIMGIAVCGFVATLIELRRAQFAAAFDQGLFTRPAPRRVHARHKEQVAVIEVVAMSSADLDRVLAKISREGMASLTVSERDVLAHETERRRRG